MELLTYVLLIIIAILLFFLLKKERVLGINTEEKKEEINKEENENKKYRETIYSLLNYIPEGCLLYTSPSPRDKRQSRMPSSA